MELLYKELIDQLELTSEDTVFISSDITKWALFFKNKGFLFSPDHFIDLLQEKLSNGTLIVPAYTDLLKPGDTFDYNKSKPTTGALSNRVFRRKDFTRTKDLLHSVFVWGKWKNEILALADESTFGANSIFGFADRIAAKMIIIDVHFQNSFTFVHYIEEKCQVPSRKPYRWKMKVIDGEIESEREVVFYTKKSGYLVDLNDLQNHLIKANFVKEKGIFGVPVLMMNLNQVGGEVENYLKNGGKTYAFSLNVWLKQLIKRIIGRK